MKPTYKKLRLKKRTDAVEIDTNIGPPVRKQLSRRGVSENDVLKKLEAFKQNLKATPTTEDESWKGHALVFEKESKVIDPMSRNEGQYEYYDPLKDARKGSAAALQVQKSWHQRRLDHSQKSTEKW